MTLKHGNQPDERLIRRLQRLRQVPPRDREAVARGRVKFLAEAEFSKPGVSKSLDQRHKGWFITTLFQRKERFSMKTTFISIMIALVLFFGGAGATAYASQSALPGDTLYKVKTITEDARLALTADKKGDALLFNEFVQRRVSEIQALASQGRYQDIPAAASRFETQVRQAALNLEAIAGKDPVEARQLSDRLRQSLAQQAQLKSSLQSGQAEFEFLGIVESMASDRWTISGQEVLITSETKINDTIVVGNPVKVEALVAADGSLTASQIELLDNQGNPSFELAGIVESIAEGSWVVAGRTVLITPKTEIKQSISTGDFVKIEGVLTIDGSLVAREIELAENGDSNGNGNDNQNGNEDIGNANDNQNDNEDIGNANDNQNDNEDIGNANDSQNGNEDIGNANDDQNDNEDIGNANDNQNGNEDNGNANDNQNGNEDSENDHNGGNENENENDLLFRP